MFSAYFYLKVRRERERILLSDDLLSTCLQQPEAGQAEASSTSSTQGLCHRHMCVLPFNSAELHLLSESLLSTADVRVLALGIPHVCYIRH